MKDLVKLFSKITGIFRSVLTIIFLLGIAFLALVDVNLLVASVDIAGLPNIANGFIKPIFISISAICFVINIIITKHIYKVGTSGRYHISNLCFGLIFIVIDAFIYVILREVKTPIIYVLMALNALIVINSILGLIAKSKGYYEDDLIIDEEVKPKEFIEFQNPSQTSDDKNAHTKIKFDDNNKSATDDLNYQILDEDEKLVYESKDVNSPSNDFSQSKRIAKKKEIKNRNVADKTNKNE